MTATTARKRKPVLIHAEHRTRGARWTFCGRVAATMRCARLYVRLPVTDEVALVTCPACLARLPRG